MFATTLLLITLAQAPQPLSEYDKQFLSVEDAVSVSDGSSSRGLVFTRGKYRHELSPPEFLQAVGKVDEAERYRTRVRLSAFLAAGALTAVLAGALTMASQDSCGPASDPGFSRCVEENVDGGHTLDPLLISSSLAVALFGGAMLVYPSLPDPPELRRLADEHNQTLRQRLSGLTLRMDGRF